MSTEAQRLRSRKAWQSRHYGTDDPRTIQTTRELAAAKLAAAIKATVDQAPSLTAEQRARLTLLLTGGTPDSEAVAS
jgi:hypothetical protein